MSDSKSHWKIALLSGNGNQPFAEGVAQNLGSRLNEAVVGRYDDGEVKVELGENIRGNDVFVINPTQAPAENILELALIADAAFSSAGRVTAVIPYFGYQCQERKAKPRTPISARVIARFLSSVGFHRIVLFEPHTDAMEGFFHDVRVEKAYATPVLIEYLLQGLTHESAGNLVLAPADVGGGKKTEAYLKRLHRMGYTGIELAGAHKIGTSSDGSVFIKIIGDFDGKDIVTIEDMIRTGTTAIAHAKEVKNKGARSYTLVGFHPVFTSVERCTELASCDAIDKIVVTDTLPISPEKRAALGNKLDEVTVKPLFAKLINRLHFDESISALLEYEGYLAG